MYSHLADHFPHHYVTAEDKRERERERERDMLTLSNIPYIGIEIRRGKIDDDNDDDCDHNV